MWCDPMRSIINRPAISVQEIFACRLERIVWTQVLDAHGCASNRVNMGLLDVLCDAKAVVALARDGHDGVVHDFERDIINKIVRNHLRA